MRSVALVTVDDNIDLNFLYSHFFHLEDGVELIASFEDVDHAKQWGEWHTVDIAIIDFMMPGDNGVVLGRWLKRHHPDVVRVLLTATRVPLLTDDEQRPFDLVLQKPFRPQELADIIRNLVQTRREGG